MHPWYEYVCSGDDCNWGQSHVRVRHRKFKCPRCGRAVIILYERQPENLERNEEDRP